MDIIHKIYDRRIESLNLLIEVSIEEYFGLSRTIIDKNEFQRRRVKSSSSVYNLLKTDLRQGCVVPPIVLALAIDAKPQAEETSEELLKLIYNHVGKLIILDGLQRTYTIRDLVNELETKDDPDKDSIFNNKLRIEIYVGINKLGILYRMLTLNTGQTPMSSRHQIEIIYSDYIQGGIEGVKLLREVDESTPSKPGEYKFKDIIDGFTSYLERDYLTIDRTDILDNIKSLEKLSLENQNSNLFVEFVSVYDAFVKKMVELSNDWAFDESASSQKLTGSPFAKSAYKIFDKSQVMTGFGSAIGKLVDFGLLNDTAEVSSLIDKVKIGEINDDLNNIILRLDSIRLVAKKIGNDQRMFFHFFFRELFDKKSDGYLDIRRSTDEAFTQYQRKTQ